MTTIDVQIDGFKCPHGGATWRIILRRCYRLQSGTN